MPPKKQAQAGGSKKAEQKKKEKIIEVRTLPLLTGLGLAGLRSSAPGATCRRPAGGPGLKWRSPPLLAVVRPLRPGARPVSTHAPAAPTRPPCDPRPGLSMLPSLRGSSGCA